MPAVDVVGVVAIVNLIVVLPDSLPRTDSGTSGPGASEGERAAILTSATMGKDVWQSAALGRCFFTHLFVLRPRGGYDTDQGGRVVVEGTCRHTYTGNVRAAARTAAGIQRSTFSMEFKCTESVVHTKTGDRRRTGKLSFPAARTSLPSRRDGDVLTEVSTDDAARFLVVRLGQYKVVGGRLDHLPEGTLAGRYHGTPDVASVNIRRLDNDRVVRKGCARQVALSAGSAWPGTRRTAWSTRHGWESRLALGGGRAPFARTDGLSGSGRTAHWAPSECPFKRMISQDPRRTMQARG